MLIALRRLRNLPMLLILALLFALMSLKANWVLGAPYLFWHDNFFPVGMFSLFAVAMLLEEWAFVAVLLDTDENNPVNLSSPGQTYSRISLIAAVKDNLEIEYFGDRTTQSDSTQSAQGSGSYDSALGGLNRLPEEDQERIIGSVRDIHTVGTFALAFVFGFCAAFIFQWQNENLIAFSRIGWFGNESSGLDFLGPVLVGIGLIIFVYPMFWLRRLIFRNSDALIGFFELTCKYAAYVPLVNRWYTDWISAEIIRNDSIFRPFHLIALLKNLIFFVFILLFSVAYWNGIRTGLSPSVALLVCVVLSGLLGLYGWMVFQKRRLRYEFVVGIALVVSIFALTQMRQVPTSVRLAIPNDSSELIPASPDDALGQVRTESFSQGRQRFFWLNDQTQDPTTDETVDTDKTEKTLLSNWKRFAGTSYRNADGEPVSLNQKPILVLVSNSGGGIKAQVWSALVLNAIENLISRPGSDGSFIHFPSHVRLVAGASGGMVGAGYWVATLADDPQITSSSSTGGINFHRDKDSQGENQWLTTESLVEKMAQDCLSNVAKQGFFNDLLGLPIRLCGQSLPTRGEALEDSLIRAGPAFEIPFIDLKEREDQGLLPTLIYTPTSANDGRRFLICNQPLEYLFYSQLELVPGNAHQEQLREISNVEDSESNGAYSWRLNYPGSQMTLATASRLSANFPVFVDSPFLSFRDPSQRIRIMDAGYTDNHGIYPLAAWLNANRKWVQKNTGGVLLIQISAADLPRSAVDDTKGSLTPEAMGFVTTSFNKTLFHADRLLSDAAEFLNRKEKGFFKVVTFAYSGEASLSWHLSQVERLSLIYPFLSDQQARQIVPQTSGIQIESAIPNDLLTFSGTSLDQSSLAEGVDSFRIHDFEKAENLRGKIGAQLKTLFAWWKVRLQRNGISDSGIVD